jgi:hypothetical protein
MSGEARQDSDPSFSDVSEFFDSVDPDFSASSEIFG